MMEKELRCSQTVSSVSKYIHTHTAIYGVCVCVCKCMYIRHTHMQISMMNVYTSSNNILYKPIETGDCNEHDSVSIISTYEAFPQDFLESTTYIVMSLASSITP